MCIPGGSPSMPPQPPVVVSPAPPQQITVAAPPPAVPLEIQQPKTQLRADSPVKRRRGTSRRGKAMLKVPVNAPSPRTVNV